MNSRTTALVVALILVLISFIVEKDSQLARIAENGAEVPAARNQRTAQLGSFSSDTEISSSASQRVSEEIAGSEPAEAVEISDFDWGDEQPDAAAGSSEADGAFVASEDRPDQDTSGVSDAQPDLAFDPAVG